MALWGIQVTLLCCIKPLALCVQALSVTETANSFNLFYIKNTMLKKLSHYLHCLNIFIGKKLGTLDRCNFLALVLSASNGCATREKSCIQLRNVLVIV